MNIERYKNKIKEIIDTNENFEKARNKILSLAINNAFTDTIEKNPELKEFFDLIVKYGDKYYK